MTGDAVRAEAAPEPGHERVRAIDGHTRRDVVAGRFARFAPERRKTGQATRACPG